MTDQNAPYPGPEAQGSPRFVAQASASSTPTVAPQQGIGPYTLREWIVIGAAALLLILSFFSRAQASTFIGYAPVWTLGIAWLPAVVVPLIAAALIALRRMNSVNNFGSLSIDQFASVSFVGAAVTWLHIAVTLGSLSSWVTWVGLIVSLVGVFFTIFARFVAPFSEDFVGREEVPAHVAARPVRPVVQAPRAAVPANGPRPASQAHPFAGPAPRSTDRSSEPAFSAPVGDADRFAPPSPEQTIPDQPAVDRSTDDSVAEPAAHDEPATGLDAHDGEAAAAAPAVEEATPESEQIAPEGVVVEEPVAKPEPAAQATPAAQQPFWALVPEERDVHDFEGHPIYKIGPTAWALVLEDRGTYFVMRHDDGRIGYLHNVAGVTRG